MPAAAATTATNAEEKLPFECRRFIRKFIRVILLIYVCINVVWGFTGVSVGLIFNFLRNHEEGLEGFTDRSIVVKDITDFEHQEWELKLLDDAASRDKEQQRMIDTRDYIITNCSRFSANMPSNDKMTDNCLQFTPDIRRMNYFCAIIEHPSRFQDAYRPMVQMYLSSSFLYLGSVPLILLALIWKSQCSNLLTFYVLFQLLPIILSCYMIAALWGKYRFELCGLDFLYEGTKIRRVFTFIVSIKMIFRLSECVFIVWFLYEIHLQKQRKGFGIVRANKHKVGPIPRPSHVTSHAVLTKLREPEEDLVNHVGMNRVSLLEDKGGGGKRKTFTEIKIEPWNFKLADEGKGQGAGANKEGQPTGAAAAGTTTTTTQPLAFGYH